MRWLALPCTLALGCGFSAPQLGTDGSMTPDTPGTDTPAGHARRITISGAQVAGGPHADFPLLVSLTQDWLRHTGSGGEVRSASGFDIGFFADAAGTTRLAHEVEQYSAGTGALVAWVKLPTLSATSELYLRYGDPAITASQEDRATVWSNSYAAVWHLNGALGDSTANANAGTDSGSNNATGQIASGRSFDGDNDFVDVGSGPSIDDVFIGGGTVEAWFRAASFGETGTGRIMEKGDFNGWILFIDDFNVSNSFSFVHGGTTADGAWSAPANIVSLFEWTHVAVVYDQGALANNPTLYRNGTAVTVNRRSAPGTAIESDAAAAGHIGNRGGTDRTFNGFLDEIRLSRAARTADWITTSYRNQKDPAMFYTVDPELQP